MAIILNGAKAEERELDPKRHRFIGMFRAPYQLPPPGVDVVLCPCGAMLWTREAGLNHWQLGHTDLLQYVDIEK